MTINEILQGSSIKSAAYTDRFITGEIKRVQKIMDDTADSLQRLLVEDTKPLTPLAKKRYAKLLEDVKEIQSLSNAELRAVLLTDLKDFSTVIGNNETVALNNVFKKVGVNVSAAKLHPSKIWGAVTARPVMLNDGTSYTESQAISNCNV